MKTVRVAGFRAAPPDAKRPSRVSPCQKTAVRCPTPAVAARLKSVTNSKSLQKQARVVSCARSRPAAVKEEDSETGDENGPSPVPKSARVISGRRHHRLPILVDHLMCRYGELEELESLLKRRAVGALAARRSHQTALGKFLKCFVLGVHHHHGSQLVAAVKDRWPSFSRFGSSKLPWNHLHVDLFTFILRITFMRP